MSSLNKINKFKTVSLPINFALPGASNDFPILGRSSFDYTWIFVLGAILAFTAAWGIGANDVANSFATSVGSRTLKMWQAVLIAGLCEFLGAYLLGARVTATIRSGITDVNAFVGHDDLLMFGMFCTLAAMTFWLALATFLELPVSTTHTVIGAIIGFSLCSPSGGNAVQWNQVGLIVAGWIVAPLLCGAASALLFFSVRRFILRSDNALDRAFYAFPVLVFMTITINVIFIMTKGGVGKGQGLSSGTKISDGVSVGISFAVGAVFMIFVALVVNPPLKRYINSLSDKELVTIAKGAGNIVVADGLDSEENGEKTAKVADDAETGNSGSDDILSANNSLSRPVGPIEAFFDRIFHQDRVHAHIKDNATVGGIHDNAEIFPIKIEYAFGYLQVFTAMFAAFAHGANDVANAIGPFAAINSIHESGVGAVKNASVPDWILVLGGAGIVAGLAMYGHIIIAAMGVKMVKITPARGFCIELCVAFVIIIGSYIGIPLSSTQTAIGGIIGVGLVETSVKKAVNWKLLVKVFLGWIATLIVAALSCALLFSFGTFSPSQNYPLNARNCLKQYGTIKNVTKGDASSYNVSTVDGLITGLIGFPSTGVTIPLA